MCVCLTNWLVGLVLALITDENKIDTQVLLPPLKYGETQAPFV